MSPEYTAYFRSIRRFTLFTSLLFFLAGVLGYQFAYLFPGAIEGAEAEMEKIGESLLAVGPVTLFLIIFINNTFKAYVMLFLGILGGIIPALFVFVNGFALGFIAFIFLQGFTFFDLLTSLIPHGIIEIPALIISAAMGMDLGKKYIHCLRTNTHFTAHIQKTSRIYWRFLMPTFFVAALVEAFITKYMSTLL